MKYTNFHKQLRTQFQAAIRKSCNKEGCKLDLSSLSSYEITVIDADEYAQIQKYSGKKCDYFLLFSDVKLHASVVEMKSGKPDISEALEQIQEGAKECEKLVKGYNVDEFYPLLLAQSIDTTEIKVLQSQRVQFRGKKYRVIQRKCGSKLRDILQWLAK